MRPDIPPIPTNPEAADLRAELVACQDRLASSESARRGYELLLALSPVGIFRTDAAGNCVFVNEKWSAISGLSAAEARGQGWVRGLHPEDRERVAQAWYHSAEADEPFYLEYRFLTAGANETWVLGQAMAELDAEGRVLGYVGTITDISERKRLEAQARANLRRIEGLNEVSRVLQGTLEGEDAFQELMAHVLDLFEADRAFLLHPCDPHAAWIRVPIEVTRPPYPGARAASYEAPIDAASVVWFERALATDQTVTFDRDHPLPGDPEWVRMFQIQSALAIAIRPRLGAPWLLGLHQCSHLRQWSSEDRSLLRDVALRMGEAFSTMLLFRELRQSEGRFRAIIDNTTDAIYIKDREGRCLLANPVAAATWGTTVAGIVGKRDTDFLEPAAAELIRRQDMEIMETRRARTYQETVPVPRKGVRTFLTTKFPYLDPQGEVIGVIGLSHDITELQRSLEEVAQRTTELQQAQALDHLKSQFVNSVTHELRTPLTSILGYAEFLEDEIGGALSEDQRRFVLQIVSGARRLEGLLNDLLDFARMEAGTFTLRLQTQDLRQKIGEVLESLRPQAEDAGVRLMGELPETPLVATVDPDRVGQVVLNLLSNAIKFTPTGGEVRVQAAVTDGWLRCAVIDSGEGIAEADQSRLFKRFSQLEGGLQKGKGSGLGLSISKALIEAHGGRIGVHSQPGEGSTFWFEVPVEPTDRAA